MDTIRETSQAGFRVLELTTPRLSMRCAPELGGRVFSLVCRRSGREWLWRQPVEEALFRPANQRDFGAGTFAGLDECLPTIEACAWIGGRPIGDHGEVWSAAWQVDEFRRGRLVMSVASPAFGLTLTRAMSVTDGTVRFDYRLRNDGRRTAPALWAMHPLFTFRSGDKLELPAYVRRLSVSNALPAFTNASERDGTVPYPEIAPGVFLDRLELPDSTAGWLKAFVDTSPRLIGEAAIRNANSGDALRVQWDAQAAPFLGIWLTRGGYRGWHHVALEPTNAPSDRVDQAHERGFTVTLAPGAQRTWWVEWQTEYATPRSQASERIS